MPMQPLPEQNNEHFRRALEKHQEVFGNLRDILKDVPEDEHISTILKSFGVDDREAYSLASADLFFQQIGPPPMGVSLDDFAETMSFYATVFILGFTFGVTYAKTETG